MTGEELKQMRHDLGEELGRRLSLADIAKICGMSPKSGPDQMRKWEEGDGPSGPVATLLSILAYASLKHAMPSELLEQAARSFALEADDPGDNPAASGEAIFRQMMLVELRRRLS